MPDIYLLRHGQVTTTRPWRFQGQTDQPITSEGRTQMREWRSIFAGKPLGGVVCSDLEMCRQSAAALNDGKDRPEAVVEPGLREINLGAWEGLTVAEVEEKFPGAYRERGLDMGNYVPEGGESFATLQKRALAALDRAMARFSPTDDPVIVVTHLGVCRVLVAHFLRIPLPAIFYLEQRYARAHHIIVRDGKYFVAGLNMPAKAVGIGE